ncbi:putative toxin-antitoxin system toxin component, PIN family [Candidatus Pacearchaeota archaeon]|nr:putative toxin-antitoxin system toxin component, PIN family [Candidatus Pacearchaeota archaeon]
MEIIEELIDTLKNFKIQIDEEIIERWKNLIISNSLIVESFEKLDIIQEDLEDNKFLEAAIAEKADFIISQDNHLLKLKEYLGIRIINPEEADRLIA